MDDVMTVEQAREARRERYIAHAIQGLLTKYGWNHSAHLIATKAAEFADAMIEHDEKKGK